MTTPTDPAEPALFCELPRVEMPSFVPVLELSFIADNDEHRGQVLAMLREAQGVLLVRDLHSPSKPQWVSAMFPDEPNIPERNLPDLLHRRMCPRSLLQPPA